MNRFGVKALLSLLLVALMVYSTYTVFRIAQARQVPEPPALDPAYAISDAGSLAQLAFRDQDGKKFSFADLEGQMWVASMFFTTCPHQCTQLNLRVKELSEDPALAGVTFVSMTVDPTTDTPQELHEYAERFEADTSRWTFLTGTMPDIAAFGTRILKVATGKKVHTDRLVLVDGEGKMRGAFKFSDDRDIERLRETVAKLEANEEIEEAVQEGVIPATETGD